MVLSYVYVEIERVVTEVFSMEAKIDTLPYPLQSSGSITVALYGLCRFQQTLPTSHRAPEYSWAFPLNSLCLLSIVPVSRLPTP
jgi:hypothetical protein